MPPGNFILVDFLLTHVVGATHQAQTCTGTAHIWMIQPCLRKIDGTVCQTWQPYARHPNPGSRPFFGIHWTSTSKDPAGSPQIIRNRCHGAQRQICCSQGATLAAQGADGKLRRSAAEPSGDLAKGLGGKAWETHQFFRKNHGIHGS